MYLSKKVRDFPGVTSPPLTPSPKGEGEGVIF